MNRILEEGEKETEAGELPGRPGIRYTGAQGKYGLRLYRMSLERLLDMAITKVKRGSLIYTHKFRSYNGLISYGFRHMRIDYGKRSVNGRSI